MVAPHPQHRWLAAAHSSYTGNHALEKVGYRDLLGVANSGKGRMSIHRANRRAVSSAMSSHQIVSAYSALYGPSAAVLASTMTDMGAALSAQCQSLHHYPTADACEVLAANLEGARRAVLRLKETLVREGGADGR